MKKSTLTLILGCLAAVALLCICMIVLQPQPTPLAVNEVSAAPSSSIDMYSGATPDTLAQKHEIELAYQSQITMDFARAIERVNAGPIVLTDEELAQFCYWDCINSPITTDYLFGEQEVVLPEIDFDKEYMVLSYGRKINKFEYYGRKMPWGAVDVTGFATFDTEYFPQTAFIYTYTTPLVPTSSTVGIYCSPKDIYCIESL